MRALLLLGVAITLGGCAADPTPRAASASAAPLAQGGAPADPIAAPVPDRVFTLPATTSTANASNAPPAKSAVQPDADCISAEWTGTIGNCLAPSIAVHDACGKVDYVIYYNDCAAGGIDTRYLTDSGKPPARVYRKPAGGPSVSARWEAVAIRGTINRGLMQMSNATFDVEVDFPNMDLNGNPLTVRLVGQTSR